MSTFAFVARDGVGNVHRGEVEAASAGALAGQLRERGWLIVDIRVAAERVASVSEQLAALNPLRKLPPRSFDIELSLLQMAVMLRGGLTLLTSMRTVAEQARRPSMAAIWLEISQRVQSGSSFADAMAPYPCFKRLVVQLVRVGEQTGNLEQVIVRAAGILERRRALRGSMLTALAYPAIVLMSAIGVTAFMVFSVIPKLQVFLSAMGRKLPWMTQTLVDISVWCQAYLLYLIGGIIAFAACATAIYMWPPGRYVCDRVALRVPILGSIFRLAATATFSRSLGIMIRSGITLLESLRTVEAVHRNRFLQTCVAAARENVLHGGSLAEPLNVHHAFMPMLGAMVAVGESTGTLDDVLDEVANFHEQ
ncbi:MAG TPA: type II secretion system F family protein, partial [Pirellulales bacterium]|nr:type II secretion system F family protein [Pirellulales bacterium]